MPPMRHRYRGIEAVTDFAVRVPLAARGTWRHLPVGANGPPVVACYPRGHDEDGPHRAWSTTVLALRGAELTSFVGPEHLPAFGLPAAPS